MMTLQRISSGATSGWGASSRVVRCGNKIGIVPHNYFPLPTDQEIMAHFEAKY